MILKDKVIILTGARRIGATVAKSLMEKGTNLAVIYHKSKAEAEEIQKMAADFKVKTILVQADLSKQRDVEILIAETIKKFGHIDGLVHMASPYPKTPLGLITMESFEEITSAIAGSSLLLGQSVSIKLKKNIGEDVITESGVVGKIKGKLIFFSDWSVIAHPYPDYLAYNAAKAAVNSITSTLAIALAPAITVNAIAPGPILKPKDLTEEENKEALAKTPLGHWGGTQEIAKAVLFLMDSDFVTGVVLPVDGGRTIG